MSGAELATVLIAMLGGALRVSTPFIFVALGKRSRRNQAASISGLKAISCSVP